MYCVGIMGELLCSFSALTTCICILPHWMSTNWQWPRFLDYGYPPAVCHNLQDFVLGETEKDYQQKDWHHCLRWLGCLHIHQCRSKRARVWAPIPGGHRRQLAAVKRIHSKQHVVICQLGNLLSTWQEKGAIKCSPFCQLLVLDVGRSQSFL